MSHIVLLKLKFDLIVSWNNGFISHTAEHD